MVLVEVPFAGRIWALPVLTALTPSKAWSERHEQRHRTLTEWARLMLLTIHRWLPGRPIVAVADGEFAALELLHGLRTRTAVITRLRKGERRRASTACSTHPRATPASRAVRPARASASPNCPCALPTRPRAGSG